MRFEVCKVNQIASGGSFVVIYEATIVFTGREVTIEVADVEPAEAEEQLIERASDSILRGARRALESLGRGAHIIINMLVIHPDFKESAFERFTYEEITRLARLEAEPN